MRTEAETEAEDFQPPLPIWINRCQGIHVCSQRQVWFVHLLGPFVWPRKFLRNLISTAHQQHQHSTFFLFSSFPHFFWSRMYLSSPYWSAWNRCTVNFSWPDPASCLPPAQTVLAVLACGGPADLAVLKADRDSFQKPDPDSTCVSCSKYENPKGIVW